MIIETAFSFFVVGATGLRIRVRLFRLRYRRHVHSTLNYTRWIICLGFIACVSGFVFIFSLTFLLSHFL